MKYVAFLDILGFKDLVENNTTDKLIKIYNEALSFAEEKSFTLWEHMPEINDDASKLNYIVISDSILVWSQADDSRGFAKVIITVQSLVYAFLIQGLPLRGAIVRGNLESLNRHQKNLNTSLSYSVHIGDSLVKAYNLEKQQNWSGCIVTEDAINNYVVKKHKDDADLSDFIEMNFLAKYIVPLKSGPIEEKYVINWPALNRIAPIDPTIIRDSFGLYNKNVQNWDVEIKIRNTIDFFNKSIINNS